MYPAMLNIKDKRVTVIGGGRVAYRKVLGFLRFGACVRIVSPQLIEAFNGLIEEVEIIRDRFDKKYLDKSFIVVAATDDKEINKLIGKYCDREGILCNVIDQPELSSFIVPAYMCQGDLTISVSTNGKSPVLAQMIRDELESRYDECYKEKVEVLGRLRDAIIRNEQDLEIRKSLIRYTAKLELEELKEYETSYLTS